MRELSEAIALLEPRERQSTLGWCIDWLNDERGRPYDHDGYPNLGAPGGPFEAFDDPLIQFIWLQYATRLGKTFFGEACQIATAALDPCPMMFVCADKKLAGEVVERTYKMLRRTPLAAQMLSDHKARDDYIELGNSQWFVGWASSVNTLADKQVRIGHGSEVDKWPHFKTEVRAREADPLRLFINRGKDYPTRKFIFECSPTVKGQSRIERGRLASDNRQHLVPCPHCGWYQVLRFSRQRRKKGETADPRGTVVWDHLPNGRSDPDLAYRTARYVCADCGKDIADHHRAKMMRAGVWVPEGCGLDPDKAQRAAEARRTDPDSRIEYLTGEPLRRSVNAGFQLASLYAISLTWGDCAKEFVTVSDRPSDLQDFINSWLGETWEANAAKQTWEELGERIIVGVPAGEVPTWATLLTMGVDKQEECYRWEAVAWGPGQRAHVVAYGTVETLDELLAFLDRDWRYQDDGVGRDIWPTLRIKRALFDSGFRPRALGSFLRKLQRKGRLVYPCKGASQPLDSPYKKSKQDASKALPGMVLILVDTRETQDWIDHRLHTLTPEDAGGFSLYAGAVAQHQDFLEQMLNDHAVLETDQRNQAVETWNRADVNLPNDFRDCARYAYVAMLLETRGQPIRERGAGKRRRPRRSRPALTTPDGRPFLVTER